MSWVFATRSGCLKSVCVWSDEVSKSMAFWGTYCGNYGSAMVTSWIAAQNCIPIWGMVISLSIGNRLDGKKTYTVPYCLYYPGWWFGTCFCSSIQLGIVTPTDFHIFQRGRSTTNLLYILSCDRGTYMGTGWQQRQEKS